MANKYFKTLQLYNSCFIYLLKTKLQGYVIFYTNKANTSTYNIK